MRKFILLMCEENERVNVKLRFESMGTAEMAKKICIEFSRITGYKHGGITFFGKNHNAIYWYKYDNGKFEKGTPKKWGII